MKIKPGMEQEYSEYKELNTKDGYSAAVVNYTEHWAGLMENRIEDGKKIEDIAQETSHQADIEGITGFMYGCAVAALARFWEHGEQLRKWSNLKIQVNDEGEKANESGGVLNPAILVCQTQSN